MPAKKQSNEDKIYQDYVNAKGSISQLAEKYEVDESKVLEVIEEKTRKKK